MGHCVGKSLHTPHTHLLDACTYVEKWGLTYIHVKQHAFSYCYHRGRNDHSTTLYTYTREQILQWNLSKMVTV